MRFTKLFEPLQIGRLRLKNRIGMAPMGLTALHDANGVPTERFVDYCIERARGGAGLLITGMLKVEENIEFSTRKRGPVREEFVRPLAALTETIHSLGTKIFAQLSAGFGCMAKPSSVRGGPVAPSAIPNFAEPNVICRPLRTEEVEQLVKAYGKAAEIVARAGVDGIELHGHGGFLLDQFATSLWNKRDDKYGGDLRGRLTFASEVISAIRDRLGANFPVTYRFGAKHYMKSLQLAALPGETFKEIGRDLDESIALAKLLEETGVDALSIDAGSMIGHYWAHPPIYQEHGCNLPLAAMVKGAVRIPVFVAGRLDMPELADQALREGKADLVMIGKGLLADPEWPNKVLEGRLEDIRPCIACHQACTEMSHGREPNSCTVNPASGRERSFQLTAAANPRRILVAGGGVAGMEAARVAATRGHSVTLYEKSARLGGYLQSAAVPNGKKDFGRLNDWYQRQLARLGVDIRINTELTADTARAEQPDAIVVASGSIDVLPSVPGVDKRHVLTMTEALLGQKECGGSVVVVGAGESACELALWLAGQGKSVTIVNRQPQPVSEPLARANKNMLLDLLTFSKISILKSTTLTEIRDNAVVVSGNSGEVSEIACDTVVLAIGRRAQTKLYDKLAGKIPSPVYAIGDCDEPGNFMKAVWDGFEVGRTI